MALAGLVAEYLLTYLALAGPALLADPRPRAPCAVAVPCGAAPPAPA